MAATLRFENVGLRFAAGLELLSDLDVAVHPGEMLLVTGARGSGRSALAALAALARPPGRGLIRCLGQDAARLGARERASLRRRIGYGAERALLVPGLDAGGNVALAPWVAGISGGAEARADADDLLGWLGGPGLARRRVRSLSSPETRIVGLARALVIRPELLVLDEPLRAGEERLAERLRAILDEMLRQGAAILVTGGPGDLSSLLRPSLRLRLEGGRLEGARSASAMRAGTGMAPA